MASHILWRHHQSVAHRSFQNLVQPHVAIHPLWCRLSTRSVAATKGFWGRSMQCNALWRGFGIKWRVSTEQWLSLIYWHFFEPPLAIHNIVDKTHEWHLHSLRHILSTETSGILVFSGSQISLLLQAGGLGRLTKTRILGLKWSQRAKRSCSKWWKTRSYIWRRNTYATTVLHQYTKLLQWLKIWDKRCIANLWVSIFSFCWDSTLGWAAACKQHCKSLFVNFSFLFISWVHTSVAKLQGSFESSNCWIYFVWIYKLNVFYLPTSALQWLINAHIA